MLAEACFVWNHALALQKRYYRLCGGYIPLYAMQTHQAKRIKRSLLSARMVDEVLKNLDVSFKRFFNHIAKRPPKYKNPVFYTSIVLRGNRDKRRKHCYIDSFRINDNKILLSNIKKQYKFYKCRNYEGEIKRIIIKRNRIGEYYIYMVLEKEVEKYGKSHNGASVGIDFGLKTYLTLSDGTRYENPLYMRDSLNELRRCSHNLSKCKKGSNNRERKRKELAKLWDNICNKRDDYQWKLAHELCRKYDNIFIEDLNLSDMKLGRMTNRKLKDQAHAEFITKLLYVATKYDVVVHKIDRYYPSSKTCTCGYVNKELKLTDRRWVCPECGAIHDRDLLAANNILRRGIVELESNNKTKKHIADGQLRYNPTITCKIA